jgi:hypothetical protein
VGEEAGDVGLPEEGAEEAAAAACVVRRLTFTATFDDGVVTLHLVLADEYFYTEALTWTISRLRT